jgi:hypothetical protein
MRVLPFGGGVFASVLSLFASYGYFLSETENEAVLGEARRVLRDGGSLVLDLPNPYDARRRSGETTERAAGGFTIRETRCLRDAGRRIEKQVTISDADGRPVREYLESLRLYEPDEIAAIASRAGLTQRQAWGDYDGRPWKSNAPRLIILFEAAPVAGRRREPT